MTLAKFFALCMMQLLLIWESSALLGLLISSCGAVGGSSAGSNEDDVTLEVSGLDAETTYYWKVVAEDGDAGAMESEVRKFTTK